MVVLIVDLLMFALMAGLTLVAVRRGMAKAIILGGVLSFLYFIFALGDILKLLSS